MTDGIVTPRIDLMTFQNVNNNNYSNQTFVLGGVDYKPEKNTTLYGGVGLTSASGQPAFAGCIKANYQVCPQFGIQGRINTIHTKGDNSTQFRIAPSVKQKVSDHVSLYLTPYYAYKVNYNQKNGVHQHGLFGGADVKFNDNVGMFVEAQGYHTKDASINAGLIYKF